MLFAVIGFIDSAYLTWIKLANQEALCAGIGDCESVNTSVYSEIGGIPIALLGVGAYLVILVLVILEDKIEFLQSNAWFGIFGISLVGVLYSGFLTYIEVAVLHAICPFCVLSAVVVLLIFVLSIIRISKDPGIEMDEGEQ
jgi:uncharacterized membrane protein